MSATSTDLGFLFSPRSIAVVGASNKPGKMGNLFIQRLAAGFGGALYPVNPNEDEIAGIRTRKSIEDAPDDIDVLIALVPADALVSLVEACRPGQVRFLLAVPSGFAEVAGDGNALQERLAAAARARGIRVLGPNIVGVMNAALGLNASMMPELPPGGRGLSCVTQSGGFGMALSMYALDHDLPVAKFCDIGNTADVEAHELIDYLASDDDTRVIGLFIESVRDEDRFLRALGDAAARKPVILTPVGVSTAGRRASVAHLGIAMEMSKLMPAVPQNVIRAETAGDMLHRARALLWQARARGRRAAIVTGTGGIGAELADLATAHGLEVPTFSDALQKRVQGHLPWYAGTRNPIDMTPIWWDYPKLYPAVLDELARSGEVDLAIVSITDVAAGLTPLSDAMAAWAAQKSGLPTVVFWGARHRDHANMLTIQKSLLPCFPSTRETVRAAAALP